eukprot:jgi/Chrpa1/26805/Chrysochromulina_OHIO_Genome00022968-RA
MYSDVLRPSKMLAAVMLSIAASYMSIVGQHLAFEVVHNPEHEVHARLAAAAARVLGQDVQIVSSTLDVSCVQ